MAKFIQHLYVDYSFCTNFMDITMGDVTTLPSEWPGMTINNVTRRLLEI